MREDGDMANERCDWCNKSVAGDYAADQGVGPVLCWACRTDNGALPKETR